MNGTRELLILKCIAISGHDDPDTYVLDVTNLHAEIRLFFAELVISGVDPKNHEYKELYEYSEQFKMVIAIDQRKTNKLQ